MHFHLTIDLAFKLPYLMFIDFATVVGFSVISVPFLSKGSNRFGDMSHGQIMEVSFLHCDINRRFSIFLSIE